MKTVYGKYPLSTPNDATTEPRPSRSKIEACGSKSCTKVPRSGSKSPGNVGKINILNQLHILGRIDTFMLQGKSGHLWHAAFSLSEKNAPLHVIPVELSRGLAAKRNVPSR